MRRFVLGKLAYLRGAAPYQVVVRLLLAHHNHHKDEGKIGPSLCFSRSAYVRVVQMGVANATRTHTTRARREGDGWRVVPCESKNREYL